jgi:hypothetical protein
MSNYDSMAVQNTITFSQTLNESSQWWQQSPLNQVVRVVKAKITRR